MAIARVQDGELVERRDMPLENIPEHKRSSWLPIVFEGAGSIEQVLVESTQVRIVRSNPAPTVQQLTIYADHKRDAVSDAGIVVNIGTVEEPLNVSVTTTTAGRTDVLGLMQMAALGLPITWYQASGEIPITLQQLTTIALALAAHRAAAVAVHTGIWVGITATPPTVTTFAEIEEAPWPTS